MYVPVTEFGIVAVGHEVVRSFPVPTQAFGGTDPQVVVIRIKVQRADIVVHQAVLVVTLLPVHPELVTIVPVESVAGSEPHEALAVLRDTDHGVLAQTVPFSQFAEREPVLSLQRNQDQQQQYSEQVAEHKGCMHRRETGAPVGYPSLSR